MTITIENGQLVAKISEKGAELTSLISKDTGLEYIWQADPEYWNRHAPILFPFVGRLKDNQYRYQGKTYAMGQHGFARDMDFTLVEQSEDTAVFSLKSSEKTRENYPFDFELFVTYELGGDGLRIRNKVINSGDNEMIFAIGGHPAFRVPLEDGFKFSDYYLAFSPQKSRIKMPLNGPFVDLDQKTLGQTNTNLHLTRKLFQNDALIFETIGANSFSIRNEDSEHSITLHYSDIPYVGFWSPYEKEAPFVCIEPWHGFADPVNTTGDLEDKPGMNRLQPREVFETNYAITVN